MTLITKGSIALVLIAIAFLPGCKKSDSNPNQLTPPDLTTQVISKSVSGFVTDENDLPVRNATVQVGTATTQTDTYGYFKFQDVSVVKNAAVITVINTGYFKAVKTYIANPGKSAFFRIKLIPKTIVGNLNASYGGTVVTSDGMSITLPAASIVLRNSNLLYSGTVSIAAQWLSPARNDLANVMPGDLRGLNANQDLQVLTTYGMAAVELTGSAGEALQVAPGKKATISFPIPASFVTTAPATIPLWYFNETAGLWVEEGNATKSGSNYIGEVAHFSFWNCDLPNNYVQFDCSLFTPSGTPFQHAFVKIFVVNDPVNQGFGYTDTEGYVGGAVPDNAVLQLQVFTHPGSNSPCYSQNFTTGNSNVSLGNITISSDVAHVTGTVTDCNNAPVTNGGVYIEYDNIYYRYPLTSTGTYSFSQLLCSNSTNAIYTITGVDYTTLLHSNPVNYLFTNGPQANANIQVCNAQSQEFYSFTVNGVSLTYTKPPDYIQQHITGVPLRYYIDGNNGSSSSSLFFEGGNMSVGSQQELTQFTFQRPMKSPAGNPVNVNITEYGAVGEFVSGNFSGTLQDWHTNVEYEVSCNFRIKRIF